MVAATLNTVRCDKEHSRLHKMMSFLIFWGIGVFRLSQECMVISVPLGQVFRVVIIPEAHDDVDGTTDIKSTRKCKVLLFEITDICTIL
jgi:hypothetical protein